MNEFCVIAKNLGTYFIKRLIEEVGDVDLHNPWEDTVVPKAQIYLVRTTGVYRDDRDLRLFGTLDKTLSNPLPALKLFREKGQQQAFFARNGLATPPTLDLREATEGDVGEFSRKFDLVIVKPQRGQGGWGIKVLNSSDVLAWWRHQTLSGDVDFILQPYLRGYDEYRVFFVGSQTITLKRSGAGDGPANFAAGGHASVSSLPSQVPVAELIRASGCHYGAIDVLVRGNDYSILELNTSPGIEQLEMVSGQNIMKTLLSYLKSL